MGRYYRVGEVAALTHVSVRTLHHYDRIGLLRPALYSAGGYRMYGEAELLRLQQILTLRYLGFPLRRIGELLERADFDLVASLRVQGQALHDRIAELERISAAIGELVDQRLATGEWAWQLIIEASRAVGAGLTRGEDMMDAYYTPEQMTRFEEARQATPAEEIDAVEQGWTTLLAEIRAARAADLDPASAEARHWPTAGVSSISGRCGTSLTSCGMPSRPITSEARSRETSGRRKRRTSRSSSASRPPAPAPAGAPIRNSGGERRLTGFSRRGAVDATEGGEPPPSMILGVEPD